MPTPDKKKKKKQTNCNLPTLDGDPESVQVYSALRGQMMNKIRKTICSLSRIGTVYKDKKKIITSGYM